MLNERSLAQISISMTSLAAAPLVVLGVLLGIILPVVSAVIFPTYTHMMAQPGLEWLRLIEAPFALAEASFIGWAMRRGMEPIRVIRVAPRDIKIALVFLLIGIFVSSILVSKRPADSITVSFFTLIHLLFFLAVAETVRGSQIIWHQRFIYMLGGGLVALACLTTWRFLLPPNPSHVMGGVIVWDASLPGFINVRHFGSWTGAVCAAFLVLLLNDKNHRSLSWSHFFYFLAATMTIWSGTRAAIFALAVTASVMVAMTRKLPTVRAIGILAFATGAALIAAWLMLPVNEASFQLFAGRGVGKPDELASGRLAMWQATYERWLVSPWFGWGSGSTFWEVFIGWSHTQPHNAVLQFLISWGIIGAGGALWLLGRGIFAAHRQTLLYPELQPLLAILYTLLIMSLLEGMLHYPRFIMLIMAMFAVILTYRMPPQVIVAPH